jgi:hypothetical protein
MLVSHQIVVAVMIAVIVLYVVVAACAVRILGL